MYTKKRLGGKIYLYGGTYQSKASADTDADRWRKKGYKVRIIRMKQGYILWKRYE